VGVVRGSESDTSGHVIVGERCLVLRIRRQASAGRCTAVVLLLLRLEGKLPRVGDGDLAGCKKKNVSRTARSARVWRASHVARGAHLGRGLAGRRAKGLNLLHNVHRAVVEDLAKNDVAVCQKRGERTRDDEKQDRDSRGTSLRLIFPRDALSSQEVFTVVMKNCEPLVLGPALAMERMPGPVCSEVVAGSG
jgi:hypothetical protein